MLHRPQPPAHVHRPSCMPFPPTPQGKPQTVLDLYPEVFIFFNFYQFIATNLPPSTLMHTCSVLEPHGPQPARLLCPWDFPGKNTGVGCHFLLQP